MDLLIPAMGAVSCSCRKVPPVSPKLVTQLSHAAVPSRMRAQGHTPGAPRIPREIKEVTGAELTKLCVDTLKADTAGQV